MMTARLELRVTEEEKKLWDVAAVHAGLTLSEYVRTRVNESVGREAPANCPQAPEQPAPALLTVPQAAVNTAPPAPPRPKAALWLCADCARVGTPSCPVCTLLNGARG